MPVPGLNERPSLRVSSGQPACGMETQIVPDDVLLNYQFSRLEHRLFILHGGKHLLCKLQPGRNYIARSDEQTCVFAYSPDAGDPAQPRVDCR